MSWSSTDPPPCHWCRCDQVFRMHRLLGCWISKNSNKTVSDDVVLQAQKETRPHLTYRLLEDKDTARCFKSRRCSWIILVTVSSKDWLTGRGSCCSGPVLGMCTGEACSALGCPLSWAADLELEGPRTEANILRHCPLSLYSSRGIFILFSFF